MTTDQENVLSGLIADLRNDVDDIKGNLLIPQKIRRTCETMLEIIVLLADEVIEIG